MSLEIIPVCLDAEVDTGTDLSLEICSCTHLEPGDILIVSQKIISKQEGRIVRLDSVRPSILASGISAQYGKDPRLVELILSETRRIVRMGHGILVVETHHGFVCANAGIDESNVPHGYATLLPADPDLSAQRLYDAICQKTGVSIPVIISDTFGRPFRLGQTDCAIGSHGMPLIRDYRGTQDSMGRKLRVSEISIADELCAAAELVKSKSSGCPAALVRGMSFSPGREPIRRMLRQSSEDLFL